MSRLQGGCVPWSPSSLMIGSDGIYTLRKSWYATKIYDPASGPELIASIRPASSSGRLSASIPLLLQYER